MWKKFTLLTLHKNSFCSGHSTESSGVVLLEHESTALHQTPLSGGNVTPLLTWLKKRLNLNLTATPKQQIFSDLRKNDDQIVNL